MAKERLVTGLFKARAAAEAAVDAIIKRGYSRDDISVLMSDATKHKEFAIQAKTHAADGAGIGGAVGGTVGALLATLMAVELLSQFPRLALWWLLVPSSQLWQAQALVLRRAALSAHSSAPAFQSIAPRSTMRACARGAFCWASKPSQATMLTNSRHCSKTWAPYTFVKNRISKRYRCAYPR
jgi:hypothetical protein